MAIKDSKKTIAAIAVIVCGGLIFTAAIVRAFFYTEDIALHAEIISPNIPTELIIPKLNIDAKVLEMGITAKGNMEAPHNFTDVGWYEYGTIPGNIGSAVIDGHVDNGLSLPAVFKNLKTLQKGDDIFVMESSTQLHFVVTDIERYYYTSAPLSLIFNAKDGRRLNLITCDGSWVTADKTDDHRIVVFAILKQ